MFKEDKGAQVVLFFCFFIVEKQPSGGEKKICKKVEAKFLEKEAINADKGQFAKTKRNQTSL